MIESMRPEMERIVLARLGDVGDTAYIGAQLVGLRTGLLCDMCECPMAIDGDRAIFAVSPSLKIAVVLREWEWISDPDQFRPRARAENVAPMVMRDIASYQAVAVDVATGQRPVITSRSKHREFLKRNDYVEVGNEPLKPRQYRGDHNVRDDLARATKEVLQRRGLH